MPIDFVKYLQVTPFIVTRKQLEKELSICWCATATELLENKRLYLWKRKHVCWYTLLHYLEKRLNSVWLFKMKVQRLHLRKFPTGSLHPQPTNMRLTAKISAQTQKWHVSQTDIKYDRLEETSLGLPKPSLKPNVTKERINSLALSFFPLLISISINGHHKEKKKPCPFPAICRIMSLVAGFCVHGREDERQGKEFGL